MKLFSRLFGSFVSSASKKDNFTQAEIKNNEQNSYNECQLITNLKQYNFELSNQIETQQKIIQFLIEKQEQRIIIYKNFKSQIAVISDHLQALNILSIQKDDEIANLTNQINQLDNNVTDLKLQNETLLKQDHLIQETDIQLIVKKLIDENALLKKTQFIYNDELVRTQLYEQLFEYDNDNMAKTSQLQQKELQITDQEETIYQQKLIIKELVNQLNELKSNNHQVLLTQINNQYSILEQKYKNEITEFQNQLLQQKICQ